MFTTKIEWVYILSNEAFDKSWVKVGKSDNIDRRTNELFTTGVPTPFKIEFAIAVIDAYSLEQKVHKVLDDMRINDRREFFRCGVDVAKQKLIETAKEHGKIYEMCGDSSVGKYEDRKTSFENTKLYQKGFSAGYSAEVGTLPRDTCAAYVAGFNAGMCKHIEEKKNTIETFNKMQSKYNKQAQKTEDKKSFLSSFWLSLKQAA